MTVRYSTPAGDPEARRMCTTRGNKVTIIFDEVHLPLSRAESIDASKHCADAGDIPELELDQYNAPQDARTAMAAGDGSMLLLHTDAPFGLSNSRDPGSASEPRSVRDVILSPRATENRKGSNNGDRYALLASLNDELDVDEIFGVTSRSQLVFRYVVCNGDRTDDLEYRDVYSLEGHGLKDSHTGVAANLQLPPPGFGGSYRHHLGESISARRSVHIDTSQPSVQHVTSAMNDGVYGEGDLILIDVVFDHHVLVKVGAGEADDQIYYDASGAVIEERDSYDALSQEHELKPGLPYLSIKVGRLAETIPQAQHMWYPPDETSGQYVYTRKAYYHKYFQNRVTFRYIVQDLDYSRSLEYVDQYALQLNGGSILRASTYPATRVGTVLPPPATTKSLSGMKMLMVYPLPARVVRVQAQAGSENVGAFEVIDIKVTFGWGQLTGWRGPHFITPLRGLTNR